MTIDLDRELKQRILSERAPDLAAGFEAQTVALLMRATQAQAVMVQGQISQEGLGRRSNWVMALVLALTLLIAWRRGVDKLAEDDELMRVDTLSMSSLLVL